MNWSHKDQTNNFIKIFDDANNLKLTMLLLSDKLKNLQLEGFHTLKFFVANPKRSQKVTDILIKNKANFIEFSKLLILQVSMIAI